MKKYLAATILLVGLTACTHNKVEVAKLGDSDMSCAQIANEMTEIKDLRKSIKDKTGFSGRNVGMALVFWPGVAINEYNGSNADELAAKRQEKLVAMYDGKRCESKLTAR